MATAIATVTKDNEHKDIHVSRIQQRNGTRIQLVQRTGNFDVITMTEDQTRAMIKALCKSLTVPGEGQHNVPQMSTVDIVTTIV